MIPLGYLFKHVAAHPDWLAAPGVVDLYSLSGCMSANFADYVNYWRHNGYWLFDSPEAMTALAAEKAIDLTGARLFYYEAHDLEFDETKRAWRSFSAEPSFVTSVRVPARKELAGYDVTSFSTGTTPECSPLSCNGRAEVIPTNEHCLLRSFEEAHAALEDGQFDHCEPGPYRIIAVYTVDAEGGGRGAANHALMGTDMASPRPYGEKCASSDAR